MEVMEEGGDMGKFRQIEHKTGCSILDHLEWKNGRSRETGEEDIAII